MSIDLGPEIREGISSAKGLAESLNVTERVAARLMLANFAEYAAGLSGADAVAAEATAGAATGWAVIIIILLVVAILELVAWIASVIVTPLSWVPMVGPRISRSVYTHFTNPIDGVIGTLNKLASAALGHWVHQLVQLIGWAARQSGLVTMTEVTNLTTISTGPVTVPSISLSQQVAALQTAEHHLQQEIDSIEYRLDHPANGTATAPQVWQEIGALQRAVLALDQAYSHQATQIGTVQDRQTALEHAMAHLSSQLHGISAVAVTWQNIADELNQLSNTVTSLANQTAQDLAHQEIQLTQLAPLGILLQPGVAGLRVLRSLEDKPCQCPEFGNVPNWIGTALAVMEYVENG